MNTISNYTTIPQYVKFRIEEKAGKKINYPKDCEILSREILNKCNVNISASTLKRIFGFIKGNILPRKYTYDLIAIYCGYQSWQSMTSPNNIASFKNNENYLLHSQELTEGTTVSIKFIENQELILRYTSENEFVCFSSELDIIKNDDILNIVLFEKSYPLICENIIRNLKTIGPYISDTTNPITAITIFKVGEKIESKEGKDEQYLITIDNNYIIKSISTNMLKIFNLTIEKIIDKKLEVILTEDSNKLIITLRNRIENGEFLNNILLAFSINNFNQVKMIASMAPIYESGQLTNYQIFMKIIDETKLLEIPKHDLLDNIEPSNESEYNGCMILGQDWTYLYVNETMAEHGMNTVDFLIGKKITDVYPEIHNTRLFFLYNLSMNKKTKIECVEKFIFSSGIKRWFGLKIEPTGNGILVLSKHLI